MLSLPSLPPEWLCSLYHNSTQSRYPAYSTWKPFITLPIKFLFSESERIHFLSDFVKSEVTHIETRVSHQWKLIQIQHFQKSWTVQMGSLYYLGKLTILSHILSLSLAPLAALRKIKSSNTSSVSYQYQLWTYRCMSETLNFALPNSEFIKPVETDHSTSLRNTLP